MHQNHQVHSYFVPNNFPPEFVPQESSMDTLHLRMPRGRFNENLDILDKYKDSLPSELSTTPDKESIHVAIRPYIFLGQCFGMVPVCGIFRSNPSHLRFSWKAKRVIYAICLLLASVMIAVVQISSSVILRGLTYRNIVDIISLILSVVEISLCLRQAQTWPKLISEWTRIEQKMKYFHPVVKYNKKIKLLVSAYFFGAVLLVVAQTTNYMNMLRRCSQDPLTLMKLAVVGMYYPFFSLLGFSVITTTILMCLTMHHYIVVIFDELTVTVLSYCLAVKFRQLNGYLIKNSRKKLPWTFWAETREAYNSLSFLTKQLDSHLSYLTLMCFGSNLYYNCSMLLTLLSEHKKNTWGSIYIFLFTLTRTFIAGLAASYVAEDSKRPLSSLFSVASDSYNIEVCRFQMQVTHDDIAITGCKFFSVNRSFILTVAGTILTYEIVLLQFGNINLESNGSTNNTQLCLKVLALLDILCPLFYCFVVSY